MKYNKKAMALAASMIMAWCFTGGACAAENEAQMTVMSETQVPEPADDLLNDLPSEPEEAEPAEDAPETAQAAQSEEKVQATGTDLEHVKGLIEGAGADTISKDLSDGLSWEEIEEEETEEKVVPAHIPGFTVDPSKYPAANITENTQIVYWYLVDELELSHAAACGVLANIQLESNFRPLALGDSGTSFGICQWHLGRLSNLIAFCNQEELDYHTLEGQLAYLQYELEGGYSGVMDKLTEVEDTAEGAYEAGYWFCTAFEIPDQTILRSQRRGNLAANEYFEREFERPEDDEKYEEIRLELKELRKYLKEMFMLTVAEDISFNMIEDFEDFEDVEAVEEETEALTELD